MMVSLMRCYLLSLALVYSLGSLLPAQEIAVAPPFTAGTDALQKAFESVKPGAYPATVLLEETRYDFDASGRQTYHNRVIFKVWTKEGAEDWAMVQRNWSPWREERPSVRARVIAPDGAIHELDPNTIADSPAHDDDNVLSDRRRIQAPLPALAPGSIVEQEVVIRETVPPLGGGALRYFYFGGSAPTLHTRVEIRTPEDATLRYRVQLLPELKTRDRKANGMREIVFEQGAMEPLLDPPPYLPPDAPRSPHIVFSTAKDWNTAAAVYAAVVEKQLAGFNGSAHAPKLAANASREMKIEAVVNLLNDEIRYTGIEFSEASMIPHTPSEVLKHKYGDCKDNATLEVALLRALGIEAYVALLFSSYGEDIEPDLPALDGFNHAIVYVPGQPDLWLDPTDPDVRLGVISPANQGRFAMIARTQGPALLRTPEMTAEENRIVETREFQLAELGRAKVTETSETFGTPDRDYRGQYGDVTPDKLKESLKSYVDWTYGEAKIASITHGDSADLTKPFTLKVQLEDAQRGATARTEAVVAIFQSQLIQRLPQYLREEPKKEPADKDTAAERSRTQDFSIKEPFTYEWRYRISAPPGFRLRQLPESKEEKLGPATLSMKFAADGERRVTGELRFTLSKRRFSAAEGFALRDAVVEFAKRKAILISFDQIGETDLASGKVREALVEFADLQKLHPNESLHALQTARALLAAGAGTAARAEANRAVVLEPKSSKAYIQLAEVLKHDLVGRSMEKGYDLDGAVRAYRKALELDPADDATHANLAILLEYNLAGERYGRGAKLEESLAEYKKVEDKLEGLGVPQNYPIALLWAGHNRELVDYLSKKTDNETNQMLRICGEAVLHGSKSAIEHAGEIAGGSARRTALTSAGQTLVKLRYYALAADLLEAASAGAQNAAQSNQIQTLRKTRRVEDVASDGSRPEDVVRSFFVAAMRGDGEKSWNETMSSYMVDNDSPKDLRDFLTGIASGRSQIRKIGLSSDSGADLMQSAGEFSHEGDESGWIVHTTMPGSGVGTHQTYFVIKESGRYRVLYGMNEFRGLARYVMKLLAAGNIEQARIWLDRARQEQPAGGGDDPLAPPLFSRVWQQDQHSDTSTMRVAAAMLLTGSEKESGEVIRILSAAHATTDNPAANAISATLAGAYFTNKEYRKALEIGESLLKAVPQSQLALAITLRAAYATSGKAEADRIADAHLGRFKNNVEALRAASTVALLFADTARASSIAQQIVDSGKAQTTEYNTLAWSDLVAGKATSATLDVANQGMRLGGNGQAGLMHTLAAVEAELGKTSDARATILQRMETMGSEQPNDDDWYVFGRIAEQYGLNDEAAVMYRKLTKPEDDFVVATSSYGLAQRRLKAMAGTHALQ